jgi:hypothetical protein
MRSIRENINDHLVHGVCYNLSRKVSFTIYQRVHFYMKYNVRQSNVAEVRRFIYNKIY